MKKLSDILKTIFGYGIMLSLFGGGVTFFGYVVALCIGGSVAESICVFIYKQFLPIMIYISTIMILLGLVSMYIAGELALTPDNKKKSKTEGKQ